MKFLAATAIFLIPLGTSIASEYVLPDGPRGVVHVNNLPVGAFGDVSVFEQTPEVFMSFQYSVNPAWSITKKGSNATVGIANSMAKLQTGAVANSSAVVTSRNYVKYQPGTGTRILFTGKFTGGVAGSTQAIGMGDSDYTDGVFFGYGSTTTPSEFGILRLNNSDPTWVTTSAWNRWNGVAGPKCDYNLDPAKLNVFDIQFRWLGGGQIIYSVECPATGEWVEVHHEHYAGKYTVPSMNIPSRPLLIRSQNFSNNTNIVVESASMGGYMEGKRREPDYLVRNTTGVVNFSATATETAMFSLRSTTTFQGKPNTIQIRGISVNVASVGTKAVIFRTYLNATLTGASFTGFNTNTSVIDKDFSATAFSGGTLLGTNVVGPNDWGQINIYEQDIRVSPGDIITITSQTGGGSSDASYVLVWGELF